MYIYLYKIIKKDKNLGIRKHQEGIITDAGRTTLELTSELVMKLSQFVKTKINRNRE